MEQLAFNFVLVDLLKKTVKPLIEVVKKALVAAKDAKIRIGGFQNADRTRIHADTPAGNFFCMVPDYMLMGCKQTLVNFIVERGVKK